MALATSLRMYSAGPRAAAAWRALFGRVFADLGLDVRTIEHRWPDPVEQLWQRPDLCCDFMCGWPFQRSAGAVQAIAAPVPSPARYAGLPCYCSEFLVRDGSGSTTLEQTFGQRFGWMVANSQSGFNAPRAHLAAHVENAGDKLFREVHGPLGTPARTLEALRSGVVDVVALDSFWLDLSRRHQPEALTGTRCVAVTTWTPIPLLVAAPGVDRRIVESLRERLTLVHEDASFAPLLADVLVERFVVPHTADYEALHEMADFAKTRGYETIR
jgi:ABC-type phosphate/phosphonate transport system substrate-binding protein